MKTQIILRFIVSFFFLFANNGENKSASYNTGGVWKSHHAMVNAPKPSFIVMMPMNADDNSPRVYTGHDFQILTEETVHINDFCFDRIRRRRNIMTALYCAFTKLLLMVIHLTVIACHFDHIIHSQFHYLLKTFFI
jgi:hypothetical protein